ncbi:sirohydrochlorin ferrochelatase-like protein [Trifolium pratense]|uniref:Sirohydrochlorin ferrochelatase-like protein n=1 Tax=Trifolium pratense TaxID=57577 RepID=A0A2K3MSH4_TRIPR|nr:sirohydrochlorin ferrochelatase-like protein [Trifolium pratense]
MPVNSVSLCSNLFPSFSASEIGTNQRRVPLKSLNSPSFSSKLRFLRKSTQNSSGVGPDDGVIIVDHGSRRKESNLMLNEFVEMFRHKTGYQIVEPAHMELAEPSIGDAFQSCVQQGARRVIISPFFLSPGRHWSQDIPSLSAEAAKQHPGVSYIVTAPLGLHELLVDVVNDRINYCLKHVAGDADECSVCAGTGKCILHQ